MRIERLGVIVFICIKMYHTISKLEPNNRIFNVKNTLKPRSHALVKLAIAFNFNLLCI